MERTKRWLLLLLLGGLTMSCSDMLDTHPTIDVDKDRILKDAGSMQVALDGVYATMYRRIDFVTANAHQCFGNMAVTLAADLMGDDMVQTAQGPGWFWKDYCYEQRQRYTAKIWRCYFTWKYFYEIISNCNYILSAVSTVSGDKAEIGDIAAQAYAARAFSYFMLIQSYQQTFFGHEDLPGVPIYTEASGTTVVGKGRGTVRQTYAQIDADLEESLRLFRETARPRAHISHLDSCSTHLLRARVALVQHDWAKAEESCRRILSGTTARLLTRAEATVVKGTYDDANPKNWTTGTTPFNSVESPCVLWGAQVLSDQGQQIAYASFYSNMDACTDVYYATESPKCISNWLYYQIPGTDIRKGWWNGLIGHPRSIWKGGANIDYNQFKFQWADQKSCLGDYIFMRMEEVYLVLAEALCRQAKYSASRDALWEVISRRDTDPTARTSLDALTGDIQTFATTGTVVTLLDEILLQRRIELWGETGRIFDILRLAQGWTRYWELAGGEVSNHSNYLEKYAEYLAFPPDFRECILMIPQAEIDNNPAIGPQDQNPYVQ
ncbi:MAG: RagB/SusD family nutrient uptake outer membrane protein [Bacteroidales bacterium]|nr:RagB/SusD family nutrient uptake outer membrane protein [Bacteroidales bacterium]